MLLGDYTQFRYRFSAGYVTGAFTYTQIVGVAPAYMSYPGGIPDWGVRTGYTLEVINSTSNDGKYIMTGSASNNVYIDGDFPATESPTYSSVLSYLLDDDGLPVWPVERVRINLFDDISIDAPSAYSGDDLTITADATVDGTPHTSEYVWYLSQRTDNPGLQYLSAEIGADLNAGETYSGKLVISPSALALSQFSGVYTQNAVAEMFKHCHAYVMRLSDGAIQRLDIYKELTKRP